MNVTSNPAQIHFVAFCMGLIVMFGAAFVHRTMPLALLLFVLGAVLVVVGGGGGAR